MPVVRGCNLPDELLYDVANHIWYQEQGDGTVKMGMTMVATALAGRLVAYTPKKVGRAVEAGKSCATIESGKWVGPAKTAVAGEIASVNEAMVATPDLANSEPYGAGWLLTLKPENWAEAKGQLTPGSAVAGPYEAKMSADGFAGCGA
ncbi:MAG: glycine cleavage system protein H [Alphaproteobacteria bacterium]|nr:glycine cleavage system protein H [Alphaproteobacteria bacterium]